MGANKERLISNYFELAGIDAESFHEKEIGGVVVRKLNEYGLEVRTDTTDAVYLKDYPDSFSNIYGFLKGNAEGEPLLFTGHLDTVAPGNGKKLFITEDGRIQSKGNTVAGADDIAGVASILEALAVIKEKNLKHPDIEVLITAAEEPFCEGSKYFHYDLIKARSGYTLDLTGKIGTAAISAPSIISFEIDITGKASHAGFAPEEGINALNIAVNALKEFKTGHIDEETTLNFGTIEGGSGKNIVPEKIRITGEIRSFSHEKARNISHKIREVFNEKARKAGGMVRCQIEEHIRAYAVGEEDTVVQHFLEATREEGLETRLIKTYGGSDANRLNEEGIQTIVLSCAMERVHSTEEYSDIEELVRSANLVLRLMTSKL